jgi:drug/metabolite transporter (DMT)-like permease
MGSLGSAGLRAIAALFVVLWATGFVGARFGLPFAESATLLTVRFAGATAVLAAIALAIGSRWPATWAALGHQALVGIALQVGYIAGVYAAIEHGVSAGVSSLVVGLQPVLTALVVGRWFGERVGARTWCGLLLGLAGVGLVVEDKLGLGEGTIFAFALNTGALLAITAATLYQKRFGAGTDLIAGTAVQYGAATLAIAPLAFAFETVRVTWTMTFVLTMAWIVLALSVGSVILLFVLIRRGQAARVASLFYLVPPVTAVMGWWLFDETLSAVALGGMALAVIGVALVNTAKA